MKSAFEIAMEKLEKESPSKKLTSQQLEQIRELDSLYESKIAERRVFLEGKIKEAQNMGDESALANFQRQLVDDLAILQEEWGSKKAKIRH